MNISELYVFEGEAVLGCLMSLIYRKQVMPKLAWTLAWMLAWMLSLVIALLAFQANVKISTG